MPTWIGFLRAVNVGGRPYPMAELRAALTAAGFADVETHIQTGNVRVRTPMRSRAKVEAALETVFAQDRGFEVSTIVLTPQELCEVVEDADELVAGREPGFNHYVEILRVQPDVQGIELIEGTDLPEQQTRVRRRAAHLVSYRPYHEVKGPTAAVKRALGVSTNRNVKVIRALAEKWGEG